MKAQKKTSGKKRKPQFRFGIGEWYGKSFVHLSAEERRFFAQIQALPDAERPPQLCPFLSRVDRPVNCSKPGGICSLRSYEKPTEGEITVDSRASSIRTTCPNRFEEGGAIYRWIGETILGTEAAVAVGETPFLERVQDIQSGGRKARKVGRIDNVLVVPGVASLERCPVEKQAVYFSGRKMSLEFKAMSAASAEEGLPFPLQNRRPDYRSSGPKRLLPQLEIKVPTLSTWGKKMAVVIDEDFFSHLGTMRVANDLSNAELAWFVVQYVEHGSTFRLQPKEVVITRLRDAIEGLVAAVPIPRPQFEEAIRSKLQRLTSTS
ncbi:conserved hypothetical protein [Candidatus Sulfotelmatobacter sp. SbA7]|nr:conserved hypothetical protein [Candidatus Sulfotelmatobacter sp. SbA7]